MSLLSIYPLRLPLALLSLLFLMLLLLLLLLDLQVIVKVGGPDGLLVDIVGAHFVGHQLLEAIIAHPDLLVFVPRHIPLIRATCPANQSIITQ